MVTRMPEFEGMQIAELETLLVEAKMSEGAAELAVLNAKISEMEGLLAWQEDVRGTPLHIDVPKYFVYRCPSRSPFLLARLCSLGLVDDRQRGGWVLLLRVCPFKQMQRYSSIYCSYLALIPELLYLSTPGRTAELEGLLAEAKTDSSSRLKLAVFNARSAELEGLFVKDPPAAAKLLVAEKANAVAKFAAEEKEIHCSVFSTEKRKAISPTTRAPAIRGHLLVPNGIADVKQALHDYMATRKTSSHVAHTHTHTHTHTQLGPAERPAPSSEWMQLQVNKHDSAVSAHSYDKGQMQQPTRSVLSLSLFLSFSLSHSHLAVANTTYYTTGSQQCRGRDFRNLVPVTGTKIPNGSQESKGRDNCKRCFSHTYSQVKYAAPAELVLKNLTLGTIISHLYKQESRGGDTAGTKKSNFKLLKYLIYFLKFI
jgi:hypothetical protein